MIFRGSDRNLPVPNLFEPENQRFKKAAPLRHPRANLSDLLSVGPVGYFAENTPFPELRQYRLEEISDGQAEITVPGRLLTENLQLLSLLAGFPGSFSFLFLNRLSGGRCPLAHTGKGLRAEKSSRAAATRESPTRERKGRGPP